MRRPTNRRRTTECLRAVPSAQTRYRTELDTGILSFRARDQPYAVQHDAALAALHWAKAHTRRVDGPPSPPRPAGAPPETSRVERKQSHATYWLTVAYETSPPGGDVLTPERLALVRRVEEAVTAVPRYDAFCHRVPPSPTPAGAEAACGRWVPRSVGGGACPNTTCTTPTSLLAFESTLRRWFADLAADAQAARDAG